MSAADVTVEAIAYRVSAVPQWARDREYSEWRTWSVHVIPAPRGRWFVSRYHESGWPTSVLTSRGKWTNGVPRSLMSRHSHDLDTALALAREAAVTTTVNGLTADGLAARYAALDAAQ